MLTAVMIVEGILREPGSTAPIAEGVMLYTGLGSSSRLCLLSALWEDSESDRWLHSCGIKTSHIAYGKALTGGTADRLRAISQFASWVPALVLESDPVHATAELRAGYPTILFARPKYRDLHWRPDAPTGPTPWEDITAELKRQADLRYQDERFRE